MVLTLVLGPNKNYQRIFTQAEEISTIFSEMHGNLNPEKLIVGLGSSLDISVQPPVDPTGLLFH